MRIFVLPTNELSEFLLSLIDKVIYIENINREYIWELRQYISKTAPSTNTISDSNIIEDKKDKNIDISNVELSDIEYGGYEKYEEKIISGLVEKCEKYIVYRFNIKAKNNTLSWVVFKRWKCISNVLSQLHSIDKSIEIPIENIFKEISTGLHLVDKDDKETIEHRSIALIKNIKIIKTKGYLKSFIPLISFLKEDAVNIKEIIN